MLLVQNITKSFSQLKAVDGITFAIAKGEFYGLLGPNGAGKTTTINMISAILKPDSGSILLDGENIYESKTKHKLKMGIVPQEIALYDELNALDNLLFWGSLYSVKKNNAEKKAQELLEWTGLEDRQKEPVKNYSGGMKRRVNIACALMHNPELIIMDEPTVGIDPQSRNKIFELMTEMHHQGKTILFTTHYMEEAERLCDRIGIIDKGKIIAEGTLAELKSGNTLEESIAITYRDNPGNNFHFNGFKHENQPEKNLLVFYSRQVNQDLPAIIQKCASQGIEILNIEIHPLNLETIFLHLTGRQLRD